MIVRLCNFSKVSSLRNFLYSMTTELIFEKICGYGVQAAIQPDPTALVAGTHTATHCITLQHPATHCNTLYHTATHCNTL